MPISLFLSLLSAFFSNARALVSTAVLLGGLLVLTGAGSMLTLGFVKSEQWLYTGSAALLTGLAFCASVLWIVRRSLAGSCFGIRRC